jgi:hypothetical protein
VPNLSTEKIGLFMRVLILSGIHSNLSAFEAVLKDAQGEWDVIWCLGDVVGYGPEPNECVELIRTLPHMSVKGRYESVIVENWDGRGFNPWDRYTIERVQKDVKPEHIPFLEAFPLISIIGEYTLVHGSPRAPMLYMGSPLIAALNFPYLETLYCVSGYLALPAIYEKVVVNESWDAYEHQPRYSEPHLLNKRPKIINPGCVGISSTGTPEYAQYGILDTDKGIFVHRRCLYNVAGMVNHLRSLNFNQGLIRRLEKGYV